MMYLTQKVKYISCFFYLLLFSFSFFSQSSKIIGTITDENKEPMPGVNIKVVGQEGGSVSDIEGKYSVVVDSESAELQFSFIGYKNQIVLTAGRSTIDVQMIESSKSLEEVVVVGYGKTTVKELTGATAQVKGKVLKD